VIHKNRWTLPIIIVVAASAMSWWSSKTASATVQHVRNEVIELIPMIRNNPKVVDTLVIDPVLFTIVSKTLSEASLGWSGNKEDLTVVVTVGDDPDFGDGSATHVAIIDVGKHQTIGLRILCDDKDSPVYIAGIWTP